MDCLMILLIKKYVGLKLKTRKTNDSIFKGAALVNMLNYILGVDTFYKGIEVKKKLFSLSLSSLIIMVFFLFRNILTNINTQLLKLIIYGRH